MSTIDFSGAVEFYPSSFDERYETFIKHALSFAKVDGLWLEFGVATGGTTRKYVSYMPEDQKPLYGFDWFNGLPENWASHSAGAFSVGGVVPAIEGAVMIDGLFSETLPGFISKQKKDISVLVVDCDLYSSTKTIFDNCKNNIVEGTVIIFDELHNGDGIYTDWADHEYKAFMEFVQECQVEYKWLGYLPHGEQAACIVTKKNR
jgi:hypothetical protein